jgi:lipopolysaccharide/colanic/teichoic acid biosynthesis glycosyltransferase
MRKTKDFLCELSDYAMVFILLGATSPLFILTMILIKLDSAGAIFYIQERYGKNKKLFKIYKFRTMAVDAETDCPIWGSEDDPRSTKIGRLLRVSHIDELPQLFNILKGEMSLVGPRPERPYFAERFEKYISGYKKRYAVKPGITGWSQINGLRGENSIEERTDYDIFYIENRSFILNIRILLFTPFAKPIKPYPKPDDIVAEYHRNILTLSHAAETSLSPGNLSLMPRI